MQRLFPPLSSSLTAYLSGLPRWFLWPTAGTPFPLASPSPPLSPGLLAASLYRGGGKSLVIRLLYHASLWAVFCVTPVLRTGYVNVNVNNLLAMSMQDFDNPGEPGPQAKGVNHLTMGYDVMVEGLTCPHGRVQYGCCVVVGTLSWPWMSVGRLRYTVPVRCDSCVHGDGVLADVCGASDDWCRGL